MSVVKDVFIVVQWKQLVPNHLRLFLIKFNHFMMYSFTIAKWFSNSKMLENSSLHYC